MKWICNYCQKVVEKDNFIEVLEEDVEDEEYHAWRRIMENQVLLTAGENILLFKRSKLLHLSNYNQESIFEENKYKSIDPVGKKALQE